MDVARFEIRFDSRQAVFQAGGTVSGVVHIQISQPMEIRCFSVYIYGKAKSQWIVRHSRNAETKYLARETYIDETIKLFPTGNTGQAEELPTGTHVYPFSLPLGSTFPSSFEGRRGYVRYSCTASVDRPWKVGLHTKRAFTVIHPLDLNNFPSALVPIEESLYESVERYCCSAGEVEVYLKINRSGYVPGEPIAYEIRIENESQVVVERYSMELIQIVTYTGRASGDDKYHPKEERFSLPTGPLTVNRGETRTFRAKATVPSLPPSQLKGCHIIDIDYWIQLKVSCGSGSLKIRKPIWIGTVPVTMPRSGPHALSDTAVSKATDSERNQAASHMESPASGPQSTQVENGSVEGQDKALAPPPPSYAECVLGQTNIRDEDEEEEDEHTTGDVLWAPAYPYYDWSLHGPLGDNSEDKPQAAQYIAPES